MIDRVLLQRIRKCFALSTSSNEHEAAAALAKAQALMAEHGITDADLAMADIGEAAARGSRTRRPARWEQYLCAAVRRALAVEVFIDEDMDRRYIGRGPLPKIASYAFVALFRRLKAARASYIKDRLRRCTPSRKRIRADAFCEAWALAVLTKIAALAPRGDPDPAIGRYLKVQHPGLVAVAARREALASKRVDGDYYAGLAAGRQVDLHQGMSANRAPELLGA